MDFGKKADNTQTLSINGNCVERVSDFLGVTISKDLTWGTRTAKVVEKGQKRLYFMRKKVRKCCTVERIPGRVSVRGFPAAQ